MLSHVVGVSNLPEGAGPDKGIYQRQENQPSPIDLQPPGIMELKQQKKFYSIV